MDEKQKNPSNAFWQIIFPFILGCILIIALATWTVLAVIKGTNIRQQTDTVIIFMLIPVLILLLIPLVLTALSSYGLMHLNKILPQYTYQAKRVVFQAEKVIENFSDRLVEPILRINSVLASLRVLFRQQ